MIDWLTTVSLQASILAVAGNDAAHAMDAERPVGLEAAAHVVLARSHPACTALYRARSPSPPRASSNGNVHALLRAPA